MSWSRTPSCGSESQSAQPQYHRTRRRFHQTKIQAILLYHARSLTRNHRSPSMFDKQDAVLVLSVCNSGNTIHEFDRTSLTVVACETDLIPPPFHSPNSDIPRLAKKLLEDYRVMKRHVARGIRLRHREFICALAVTKIGPNCLPTTGRPRHCSIIQIYAPANIGARTA